ncbi:MAG: YbaB/EbfC family nucleoid-associated protein [Oscillospiraceae bacterium]|nr:YbaB/EbfC family nucleoid-associated protein [Oscillospiraceae bacterium]
MKARIPRGMGGGPSNMNRIIKQAQKMQDDMKELQERLDATEYTGEAGSGLVKAVVSGKHDVVSISIKPEAVDPDDIEMLEDLIAAAVNDAISKARIDSETEMNKITGGMNIPGIL